MHFAVTIPNNVLEGLQWKGNNFIAPQVLAVINGTLDLHGRPSSTALNKRWTTLAIAARVNDTSITVKDSVAWWQPGQMIVITPTTFNPQQKETFQIASVSADGKTITLKVRLCNDRPALSND